MGESRELTELKEKYKSNPEILEFLQNITKSYHIGIIHKFLSNDRVSKNLNVQNLQNLIIADDDISYKTFFSLMVETYGEDIGEFLKKHTLINANNISTFNIFDKKFRSMFDEELIDFFARNDMKILDEIVNKLDEKSIQYYKIFEEMVKGVFLETTSGIENKLEAFYNNIDKIKTIVDGGKKEEEIARLTNKFLREEFERLKTRFENDRFNTYRKDFFFIADIIERELNSGKNMGYARIALLRNLVINGFYDCILGVDANNLERELVDIIRYKFGEEASNLCSEELKNENVLDGNDEKSKELKEYYTTKKILKIPLMAYDKEGIEFIKKLKELKEKYKENQEISEFLEKIPLDYKISIENLYRVLSNDELAKNANGEILKKLCENNEKSHEAISDLIGITFGEEARDILKERPRLKICRDIPNFYIFDKDIREMIGYGGVHTFLTYYMESESVISEIAKNKELIRYYKEFEKLTGDYFPPSALGLDEKLIKFKENLDLVRKIVDSKNPEKYIENFLLYLTDKDFGGDNSEDFRTDTLEELDEYREKRETIFNRYIEENKDIKKVMSLKYFGNLSEIDFLKDTEKILEDYLKFNQTDLTDEEMDLFELYYIFSNTFDEDVLNTLNELLAKRKDVITPARMRSIYLKIAETYKSEYVNSLFTLERAEEEVEKDEALIKAASNSIEAYEISQNKSRRYIVKKHDNNIYFVDHKKTNDGKFIYRDCIVTKNDNNTQYRYQYIDKNGVIIIKDIIKENKPNGNVYSKYIMNGMAFMLKNGEPYQYYNPSEDEEKFEKFFYHAEDMISEAELISQYNPDKEFRLEEEAAEGYMINGINSNELCVSLIRYAKRPTSHNFSYKGIDRI